MRVGNPSRLKYCEYVSIDIRGTDFDRDGTVVGSDSAGLANPAIVTPGNDPSHNRNHPGYRN